MTLLYRTPNLVIDEFEFHASVELRDGRIGKHFRWRPLSTKPQMWRLLAEFKGHPPKPHVLRARFNPFRRHMTQAEQSIVENARAARAHATP
jgi:hypothetical protein